MVPARPPHAAAAGARASRGRGNAVVQRKVGFEFEITDVNTRRSGWGQFYANPKGTVLLDADGYAITTDLDDNGHSQVELIFKPIDEANQAEVNQLIQHTVPDAIAQLDSIVRSSFNRWTRAWSVPGMSGPWNWFRSFTNDVHTIRGQLQATAGIATNRLAALVSGQHVDHIVGHDMDRANLLATYQANNAVVWGHALAAVQAHVTLGALPIGTLREIAAVVTLLATIPINARTQVMPYPKSAAGNLLARTDFAAVLMNTSAAAKAALTPGRMTDVVVDTINRAVGAHPAVTEHDAVYPANARWSNAVPDMSGLTIGAWIRALVPAAGTFWGYWSGSDLLTKKRFPVRARANELESMGALGNKVDPGGKPIFEFRTLGGTFVDDLARDIGIMIALLV